MPTLVKWSAELGSLLAATRARLKWTQAAVREVVQEKYGIVLSQPEYSKLESGKRKSVQQETHDALIRFCETHSEAISARASEAVSSPSVDDPRSFQNIVSALAGERVLGPKKSALIDALTHRFKHGPKYGPVDPIMFEAVWQVLGDAAGVSEVEKE